MAYLPQVSFQPYIRPYVGSANQELGDTVKVLTQRYDENLKAATDLDILAGLTASQVPEGDRAIVEGTVAQIKNNLSELATSDSSYYAARPKIAQLAARFAGDADIAKMKENKKIMDEASRIRNEMTARGMKVLDFSGGQRFQTVGTDANGNKTYNTYKPADEMMHNYHDAQMKFFDQLQADGSSGGLSRAAMAGFLQTSSWQGISGAKIKGQANRALGNYLNTTEGDQQLRNYTQLQGMNPEQAKQAILREMISTGMERQSSVSQTSFQQDPYAMIAARGAAKKGGTPDGFSLQSDTSVAVDNSKDVGTVDKFFQGKLKDGKTSGYGSMSEAQKNIVRNSLSQARANLGQGASEGQVKIEAHKIAKGLAKGYANPNYYALDGTEAVNNANNTFRNGNFNALTYQLADKPGKALTWSDLKKEVGLSDQEDEKVLKALNVSGYYAPGHPFTLGLKGGQKDRFIQPNRLTISLPDGSTKVIAASSDLGSIKSGGTFEYTKLIQEIRSGAFSGQGKTVKFPDGDTFRVLPTEEVTENGDQVIIIQDKRGRQSKIPASELIIQGAR